MYAACKGTNIWLYDEKRKNKVTWACIINKLFSYFCRIKLKDDKECLSFVLLKDEWKETKPFLTPYYI